MNQHQLTDSSAYIYFNDTVSNESLFTNIWFWIALAEFLMIIIFVSNKYLNKKYFQKSIRENALSQPTDFTNLIDSSFNSTALYKQLIATCHPDRFPNNPEKYRIAELLSQEIAKNKTNLKQLKELKKEAESTLGISF